MMRRRIPDYQPGSEVRYISEGSGIHTGNGQAIAIGINQPIYSILE